MSSEDQPQQPHKEHHKHIHSPRFGFSSPKLGFSSPKLGFSSPKISFHKHGHEDSPKPEGASPHVSGSPRVGTNSPHFDIDENSDVPKFYSTGRGGAGNMGFGSPNLSPKIIPAEEAIHPLHQEVFTTGRGGAGNMAKHLDQKTVEILQDEGIPSPQTDPSKPTMSNMSIGRGGFGNVRATREAVQQEKSIFEKMKEHISK
ncbi:uncharacterized protein SAPINGB_P001195 [Magnusiomyces paraingens]|uniref:Uncharacterized protein n=1 Tax=Magnusiomyces paraingens TaxID=2606893 RepID=A0A5E8B4G5_9ASCO|nr:uncharacterized protein SAPINGB_P001195 [Saprochaete ingens]VVT46401.1 unnamed protein product [Saprochaete ingens]